MNIGIGIDISGDKYGDLTEGGPQAVMLREDGSAILREDGSYILREEQP